MTLENLSASSHPKPFFKYLVMLRKHTYYVLNYLVVLSPVNGPTPYWYIARYFLTISSLTIVNLKVTELVKSLPVSLDSFTIPSNLSHSLNLFLTPTSSDITILLLKVNSSSSLDPIPIKLLLILHLRSPNY